MSERFSHDDEMRFLTTVMPDDGPAVRQIKAIMGQRFGPTKQDAQPSAEDGGEPREERG